MFGAYLLVGGLGLVLVLIGISFLFSHREKKLTRSMYDKVDYLRGKRNIR